MKDKYTGKVTCCGCGRELPAEDQTSQSPSPCPQCGSVKRNVTWRFLETIQPVHDNLRGKVKNTKLPSKKNPRVDFSEGDDLRKSDGTWMHKSRTIDKDKDQYSEIVTDPETGQVIHRCEEPLSKHREHGSAKTKKDTDLSKE